MIIGENVILRPVQKGDIPNFNKWRNDFEIKKLAMMHPFPLTLEIEEEWFEHLNQNKNNKTIYFTITYNEQVVGFTKLFNIDWINRHCYYGIIIGEKSVRGKGLGKEVTKLMINYAFKTLNLRKILLEVIDINEKAIHLYKNLGFEQEGHIKENFYFDGKWHDVLIFSLFNESMD